MSIPAEILQRYKGSKLANFFSQDYTGNRKINPANNRIFIERDPRIFRMMIKFIRSNGEMDISSLKNTDDWLLFERELNYWEIDMKYNPRDILKNG